MSDNGFVTREQLLKGSAPQIVQHTTRDGRKWRARVPMEGDLSRLEAFLSSWQEGPNKFNAARFEQINMEGRRRLLQMTLLDGGTDRLLYSDDELAAIGTEIDGKTAKELYDWLLPLTGLDGSDALNAELTEKNWQAIIVDALRLNSQTEPAG